MVELTTANAQPYAARIVHERAKVVVSAQCLGQIATEVLACLPSVVPPHVSACLACSWYSEVLADFSTALHSVSCLWIFGLVVLPGPSQRRTRL